MLDLHTAMHAISITFLSLVARTRVGLRAIIHRMLGSRLSEGTVPAAIGHVSLSPGWLGTTLTPVAIAAGLQFIFSRVIRAPAAAVVGHASPVVASWLAAPLTPLAIVAVGFIGRLLRQTPLLQGLLHPRVEKASEQLPHDAPTYPRRRLLVENT